MPCPFCDLASLALPAAFVLREETVCAFLDARPVFKGHALVIPVAHVPDLDAATPELVQALCVAAQRIARAQERGLGAQGAFVAVNHRISQSVPHLHVHVVPRHKGDGLRGFFWPRQRYTSDAERDDFAARIAAALV